jgi:sigma-E factor negative regulatory protein RseA
MTQEYENVSAMVDGEELHGSAGKELAKSIIDDPVLKAKWRSYHLTRDLLRNDMSQDLQFDISDKVAEALKDELPIIAPKSTWRELPVVSAVLPIMRQSGQLAMVACVTAMVIFGYQTYNQPEVSTPCDTAPALIGPQGGMAPVSLQRTNNVEQDRMTQLLEQRRRINTLIQDHERQLRLKNIAVGASSQNSDESSDSEVDEKNSPKQ